MAHRQAIKNSGAFMVYSIKKTSEIVQYNGHNHERNGCRHWVEYSLFLGYYLVHMNRFITFIVMFSIWLLWSGFYDPFHVTLGIISSAIVVFWTGHLFAESNQSFSVRLREWIRFEQYSVWLLWQIVLANIQVFKLAFHPNLHQRLSPSFISYDSTITGDVPFFIFVQSVTLTPGTVTASIQGQTLTIHALNPDSALGISDMESRVKRIFSQGAS